MEITRITIDLVVVAIMAGYLLIIFGLLSLIFPKALIKINSAANKFLANLDRETIHHRIITGIVSLIIGCGILYCISKL